MEKRDVTGELVVSPKRSAKTRRRLPQALALFLMLMLLSGSSALVYAQSTYPGGVTQWYGDLSGPRPLSDFEVQNAVRRALVTVVAKPWRSNTVYEGSAFFLGDTSTLVTAAHIIPDPVVSLTVVDGLGTEWPSQLVGLSRNLDLAMLRVSGMSPLPLQAAAHPVDLRSRVYVAGNPGGGAPGTVVRGLIQSTDFHSQTDTTTLDHAYRILGGPVGHGMSGGPVLDSWGRVIGVLSAGTEDGLRSVAVPIRQFLYETSSSVWPSYQPLYVGPPLISTSASRLILPPSYIGRSAAQKEAVVSFSQGSMASRNFDAGSLWIGVYPTIKGATDHFAIDKKKLQTDIPGASIQEVAIGDGGAMLISDSNGLKTVAVVWTERNSEAVWWVQTIGWDESNLFTYVTEQQEQRLATAS